MRVLNYSTSVALSFLWVFGLPALVSGAVGITFDLHIQRTLVHALVFWTTFNAFFVIALLVSEWLKQQ